MPALVAHYLGLPPGETKQQRSIVRVDGQPPEGGPASDEWYVVKQSHVTPRYQRWFATLRSERHRTRSCVTKPCTMP